ncbi:MAG TPA: riboflavin synthase subunit alpha [Gammaproteobacteria bacterium]|nr:riboflavin synthase subunit alpha [Gammaproteobacteria bacterium]
MFTGITQGLFTVTQVEVKPGMITYSVQLNKALLSGLEIGASVSVDGVCQTVIAIKGQEVTFNAIAETCRKTTLADIRQGQKVSIERSATFGSEIGGHMMAGHVYGTAEILRREINENNLQLILHCPKLMMTYFFKKGFVGINGSSLTVNDVDLMHDTITVDLIPHTLQLTDFANKRIGDKVNIELDATTVTIVETIKRLNLAAHPK